MTPFLLLDDLSAEPVKLLLSQVKYTVAQWFDRWMKEIITPNRKTRTGERYEGIIRNHINPVIGHIQLDKLRPADIKEVHTELLDKELSPSSIECCHWVMSSAMTYALRMEAVYRNPVQAVEPPKVDKTEIQPPPVEVVNEILRRAGDDENDMFPALWLTTYTGIRRGECLGLTWSNTDLKVGQISITQGLVRSKAKGLILESPKSKSGRRVIDLDEETVEVLRLYRANQAEHRLRLGGVYQDRDLVFANELGDFVNPMKMTRALDKYARLEGAPDMRVHDLRHFHASVLLQSGMNIVLVSKRLGHSSVSMTLNEYGHLLPGWQKEAAQAFAQAMKKAQ
jgi:integrase